ncbi:MAG: FKBP-type peptidyl-prolyl cis-trans isomerase [Dysgonamonadaceae bacterium]|jgi:peptidylprolyl isomerase/FKBP-type peptidyl-prolyl cis-trans isomerase FklB|nr:FKBP-type peptidyl-prolyl cis-trans isomerase [Dysgonamonadaceae bacterium]
MKKIGLYLIWIAALTLTTCNDDTDDTAATEAWKLANEQTFNAIASNPAYTELKSPGNTGSIYYRVLEKGEGTKPVYYTSVVSFYYKGWFVASNATGSITKGQIAGQKLFDDGEPLAVEVSSAYLREGLQIALQHMVKGDKWEVWIPSHLAGQMTDTDVPTFSTPAFSTLAFEIEVREVYGIDDL